MQRAFALLFLALSLTAARALGAGVEFVRVWPSWRDAESFEHISEYFTGKEDTGGQIVLRTHPEERAGFYFLVRVKNAGVALTGTKFSLQLITPDSVETKTYTFPTEVAASKTVFLLGLTGADAANRKAHPVAWKLTLESGDGQALATAQSFLWEKPAKP